MTVEWCANGCDRPAAILGVCRPCYRSGGATVVDVDVDEFEELVTTVDARPAEYRGFASELHAERAGAPVYPIWRELPGADEPGPRCERIMRTGRACCRRSGHPGECRPTT